MSDLDTYLGSHYWPADRFAAACEISLEEMGEWIQGRLIPAPSYIVSESSVVKSYAFGEMAAPNSTPGHYFHPVNTIWVGIARPFLAGPTPMAASEALKERFCRNFQAALADLNTTTWRLRDSFTDDGSPIADGLQTRCDSAWEHFLQGTFGLCVANPISEATIARKEILQEKLSHLSEKGLRKHFSPREGQEILDLIDEYAEAAMLFSPVEYDRSSRKLFVEDLRGRIRSSQR